MKAKIINYDFASNRALFEFDASFAGAYDKYHDKDVNVDVKLWKPKRSGAANRYLWVLVDKIAAATHLTEREVYRNEIKEIGGVSTVCIVDDSQVEDFCEYWESMGIGWQTDVIGSENGKTSVIAYHGSSTFDTAQMNRLIENLIYEAEQLGIDTDTPDRQAWWKAMMEEGEKEYARQHNCS